MARPDPLRNRTWGGYFGVNEAWEVANAYCYNITTPIILSLAEGARPYYTFSQKMLYQTVTDLLWPDFYLSDTTDWMNLVFTVNEGCELILTQDYSSYQRFLDMW
jgi:hypothetical protein